MTVESHSISIVKLCQWKNHWQFMIDTSGIAVRRRTVEIYIPLIFSGIPVIVLEFSGYS